MPRTKTVVPGRARRRKVTKAAKGFRGGRSRLHKSAKETLMRGFQYAYRDRRTRKRTMRRLWITRINAGARLNGLSYSNFLNGLKKANVTINRKMLSELAVSDESGFSKLASLAKENL
ncbi:MAG: 50S ribosomal protein L20 [Candidatus Eisenbacteria bacterium]|nr:50S ribosomal protein L20 [Candidatus Eisenbacteria bacterium]